MHGRSRISERTLRVSHVTRYQHGTRGARSQQSLRILCDLDLPRPLAGQASRAALTHRANHSNPRAVSHSSAIAARANPLAVTSFANRLFGRHLGHDFRFLARNASSAGMIKKVISVPKLMQEGGGRDEPGLAHEACDRLRCGPHQRSNFSQGRSSFTTKSAAEAVSPGHRLSNAWM
jgi:hypothetical protein